MDLLRAGVEVALARDDLIEAESYCCELELGADTFDTPGFRAWRRMREVRCSSTAEVTPRHWMRWRARCASTDRSQQCRYETAEVYEWMALAHLGLGDERTAAADAATTESIYDQIGVKPVGISGRNSHGPLTKRELEVLTRIAAGATNRIVAQQLFISEKTVSRHLASVYAKLEVTSRTAAVAWARQHNLLT